MRFALLKTGEVVGYVEASTEEKARRPCAAGKEVAPMTPEREAGAA